MNSQLGKNITPFIFLGVGLLFVLAGYSFTRLFFLFTQYDAFVTESASNIGLALLHGIRFDLSIIAIINAPLLICLLFLVWFLRFSNISLRLVFVYLIVVNVTALITNIVDSIYFPYTGRRSGPEVLSMANDVLSQLPQLIFVYWTHLLLAIATFVGYSYLFKYYKNHLSLRFISKKWLCFFSFMLILLVVSAARGGFQSKPIRVLNAYSWPTSGLGVVVLNTPFSLVKEKASSLARLDYVTDPNVIKDVIAAKKLTPNEQNINKRNVVVVILESFGLEYFGAPYGLKSYAPFLQNLAQEGRFFPNGIANGRRSIEAISSILVGIPSLLPEAFIRTPYQSNEIYGIGEIVKPYGYQTAFFHGAKNGSMYFDETTYRFGFDHYYGKNEYPDQSEFDGQWGIFDEPFLQFTVDKLDELSSPFLAGVFTISSHTPYTLPKKYQGVIAEGEIPMHRVIQYTDIALEQFFASAAEKSWYKDTLFVITADHTSDNFDPRFSTPLGRHQIPIILYQPNQEIETGVIDEIAQQVDIPATIVDYLNLPESDKLMPFGRSLLSNCKCADALIVEESYYWLLSAGKYVKIPQDENLKPQAGDLPPTFITVAEDDSVEPESILFNRDDRSADFLPLETRLKALLQIHNNGLIDNNLYTFTAQKAQ